MEYLCDDCSPNRMTYVIPARLPPSSRTQQIKNSHSSREAFAYFDHGRNEWVVLQAKMRGPESIPRDISSGIIPPSPHCGQRQDHAA